MTRIQAGFTLIELMIVVAIVGILAAIAIPAYQDYITRSKVSEIVATAGACKTSVSEFYATKNTFPANITSAGCSTTSTQYVSTVAFTGNKIVATATTNTGAFSGKAIYLEPKIANSEITSWSCSTDGSPKFVPANCR